jgi:hypothetical protein
MITNKVENLSDEVYEEIDRNSLFVASSEPSNVREYLDEVLQEVHERIR